MFNQALQWFVEQDSFNGDKTDFKLLARFQWPSSDFETTLNIIELYIIYLSEIEKDRKAFFVSNIISKMDFLYVSL